MTMHPSLMGSSMLMAGLKKLEKAVQEDHREYELRKAVTTASISQVVPEDYERQAYNALWDPQAANMLMMLKLIPTIPAYQIEHIFSRVTSYGRSRSMGFVGEQSVPQNSDPGFERRTVNIRLLAVVTEVFKLAALERTINVGGQTGAANIAGWTLFRNFLESVNRAFIYADTTTQRLGSSSIVFKGIIQQIREGTDGTVDSSRFGSHVIDMEGMPLTPDTLRKKLLRVINYFGAPTCMITSADVRSDFESNLDSAGRIAYPINGERYVIGQRVGGFRSDEYNLAFHTDLQCSPYHGRGQYSGEAQSAAPALPSVTGSYSATPTGDNVSKFDTNASGSGECFWIVTEVKDGNESIGRRWPATAGTTQTVGVGGEETFTLQASDPTSDSFRFYRGTTVDGVAQADTEAYFAFEVANSTNGAAVTAYDLNHNRPGCHIALVLDISSPANDFFDRLQQGLIKDKPTPAEMATDFGTQPEGSGNTIARARLGPEFGRMQLAAFALHEERPVIFSAQAPELRAPQKNIVFINIAPRMQAT